MLVPIPKSVPTKIATISSPSKDTRPQLPSPSALRHWPIAEARPKAAPCKQGHQKEQEAAAGVINGGTLVDQKFIAPSQNKPPPYIHAALGVRALNKRPPVDFQTVPRRAAAATTEVKTAIGPCRRVRKEVHRRIRRVRNRGGHPTRRTRHVVHEHPRARGSPN